MLWFLIDWKKKSKQVPEIQSYSAFKSDTDATLVGDEA